MQQLDNNYINGQWSKAGSDQFIEVVNPATSDVIAKVREASVDDVDMAVSAAHEAFKTWSKTSSAERADLIKTLVEKMTECQQEMAKAISSELGMPQHLCMPIQAGGPIMGMAGYIERAKLMDEVQTSDKLEIRKEPIGVCALITPWNYPLNQIVGKVAPALAAGCTMVLKPSEITPLNAAIFAQAIHDAGIPAGVFNLVQGTGLPVGEALVKHPLVDMVSFTGSTRAGTRISALAADDVKRVCLELGGKSPYIITEDADLAKAVPYGVRDVMVNSGQTCTALTRMLVPQSRYDEAVEIAKQTAEAITIGDPSDSNNFMGPVSSPLQYKRVLEFIEIGINEGARLVTGGAERPAGIDKGCFVQPTIFADVTNQMRIAREEIFGPVLCMIPYKDEAHAVEIANDTDYGLSSAVWAGTDEHAWEIGQQLRAGLVHINGGGFNYEAPFGGYKKSGNGREWADAGLHEFMEIKSVLRK